MSGTTHKDRKYLAELEQTAHDILHAEKMLLTREHIQHGSISVYEHVIAVTVMCLKLADRLHARIDRRSLIRGALLHDYFLYDWHDGPRRHPPHGFTHAGTALRNAVKDYKLNKIEKDMIYCHMFPLNLTRVPGYCESLLLCIADKIVGTKETVGGFIEKAKKSNK